MSDEPSDGALLLEVEDLRAEVVNRGGRSTILDGISLTLRAGETLGIVGETGAGKSMLARAVLRLLPRTVTASGSVRFQGVDPALGRGADGAPAVRAAVIFQDPMTALNPVVRIGRQITETIPGGLRRSAKAARARELLSRVGISDPERRMRQYPHELSGGLRQRVCIAIALAREPQLLVADEPTTALDVTIQRQILELLEELQANAGMGVMLITHDLGVVASITDRVIVMYAGRIVEDASTEQLFAQPSHPYTAALMAAMPRLDAEMVPVAPVSSVLANQLVADVGCRYAPRCPKVQDRCQREDPQLMAMAAPDHRAACFFPLVAVPLTTAETSHQPTETPSVRGA